MKAIAYGVLAVVGMGVGATAFIFIMISWADWAFNLPSPFWSIALSPVGAFVLAVVAFIFWIGYDAGK